MIFSGTRLNTHLRIVLFESTITGGLTLLSIIVSILVGIGTVILTEGCMHISEVIFRAIRGTHTLSCFVVGVDVVVGRITKGLTCPHYIWADCYCLLVGGLVAGGQAQIHSKISETAVRTVINTLRLKYTCVILSIIPTQNLISVHRYRAFVLANVIGITSSSVCVLVEPSWALSQALTGRMVGVS